MVLRVIRRMGRLIKRIYSEVTSAQMQMLWPLIVVIVAAVAYTLYPTGSALSILAFMGFIVISAISVLLKIAYKGWWGFVEFIVACVTGLRFLATTRPNSDRLSNVLAVVGILYFMHRGLFNMYEAQVAKERKRELVDK